MTKLVIQLGMYKKAALNTEPTFLQQFGILTNAIIVDKFPNLSNYRVAFQLIEKNDENTKALGVSVFKLELQFILIPAFFNKGKIKTGDMMYIQSIDMFRPLSDAWLADVRNMKLPESGLAIDTDTAAKLTDAPSSIRVKESTDPIIKSASMLDAVVAEDLDASLFHTVARMGKQASLALARLLQTNTDFTNSAIRFYGRLSVTEFVKLANQILVDEPEQDPVSVITPLDKQAHTLSLLLREALYRDGYFIKTASDEWQDSRQVLDAKIVLNITNQFTSPTNSCKCKLLDVDGELHDAYVIIPSAVFGCYGELLPPTEYTRHTDAVNTLRKACVRYAAAPGESTYVKLPSLVVAQTSSMDCIETAPQIGVPLSSTVLLIPSSSLLVAPSGLSVLIDRCMTRIAGTNAWATHYDSVGLSVAKDDLVKFIITSSSVVAPKGTRIIFPPGHTEYGTISHDKDGRRLGKFSKLKCCTLQSLEHALDTYKRKKYDRVKVYTEGTQYVITDALGETKPMQAKEAALHIVRQYNVMPKVAKLMLALTLKGAHSHNPKRNMFYIAKKAELDTQWERSNIAMTQNANSGPTITNTDLEQFKQDPEQLLSAIQAATETGIRLVFDVTAMKLLVQSSDISEHIGDYTADFMQSLDKLCRMLFMVYWHSDAMELKYGMLKLKSLLQSIKNAIDSLSLLTVFLKLRGFGSVDSDTNIGNSGLVSGEML